MIKVLVADDHTILREGLRGLFAMDPDIEVVGEASNGQEAVTLCNELKPHAVLMDISMPILSGLDAAKKIRDTQPETKVLFFTQHDSEEFLFQVLRAGASGYLLKKSASTEVISAIKTVCEGQAYLSPSMTRILIEKYCGEENGGAQSEDLFTAREKEVLQLIAEGHTNLEIAKKLFISLKTVQTHRAHIMEKLDLHDRTELIKYAISKGIISVS